MPKKRFSDEQIAFALRQAESGTTVGEICRKMGVAEATFHRWKKVYAGMGLSEIRRLKQLEDEEGCRATPDRAVDQTRASACRPSHTNNGAGATAGDSLDQLFPPGARYALATCEAFSAIALNSAPVQALTVVTSEIIPAAADAMSPAIIDSVSPSAMSMKSEAPVVK